VQSQSLPDRVGQPIHLKLEHHQTTGAFKLRGASNAIASLSPEDKTRGVVAASTGNHGRALAHAARLDGIRAVICMSRLVPDNKLDAIRRLGAEIRIVGNSQDDAQKEVEKLVAEQGLVMLPPFDHPDIIAGQGTLGLEIIEQVPDAASVLVPLSGGGLASGVAAAVKGVSPNTKVIGVTMARGAAMKASLDAGRPVEVEELPTLADSLGGGIGLDNRLTFGMCRDLLDDVILLSEDEIAAGIRHAYEEEREIVEGAGAVGIAALLAGKVKTAGPAVLILSGRNIDMALHRRIVCGEAPSTVERAA
ncbi:MAG: hydroxyectoine utilization dehydratase EutB, partial [Mesorhizobium sp.]